MNENYNPLEAWWEAIKGVVVRLIGIVIFSAFLLCLIAPVFSPYVWARVQKDANGNYRHDIAAVRREYYAGLAFLWIICILSWTFVFYCNCKQNPWG